MKFLKKLPNFVRWSACTEEKNTEVPYLIAVLRYKQLLYRSTITHKSEILTFQSPILREAVNYLILFSPWNSEIPCCRTSPWSGASAFFSSRAGHSILLTAGMLSHHLVPHPQPQTILIWLISFLAIFLLISFTTVGGIHLFDRA